MKLEKVRENSLYFSEKASDSAQTLAIAGIAIIWLFVQFENGKILISKNLIQSLIYFSICIALNVLYYSVQAPIWANYYRTLGKKNKSDEAQVFPSNHWSYIGWGLFIIKIFFLILGYIKFILYVFPLTK